MPTRLPLKRKAGRKAKPVQKDLIPSPSVPAAVSAPYAPEFNRHHLIQVNFRDRLGRLCSLGEGFPTDVPTLMMGGATPAARIGDLSRMDMDQTQVEYLLPFLHHFVKTGKLPAPESPAAT